MCVCAYVTTRWRAHVSAYVYVCMHMCMRVRASVHTCVRAYTCACVHVHMCAPIHTCMSMCVYAYVHVCVRVYTTFIKCLKGFNNERNGVRNTLQRLFNHLFIKN